jgi:hypothetical protein
LTNDFEIVPLVENFVYEKHLTLLAGKSGSCKSLFAQFVLNKFGVKSLYVVDLDLSNYTFHVRQKSMPFGVPAVIPVAINPDSSVVPSFRLPQFWDSLAIKIKETGARVVVFDTVLDFLEGDFNRAGDLNISMQRCRNFAVKQSIGVVAITHTSKISWNKDELELGDVADSRVITTKSDLVFGFQNAKQKLKVIMLKNRIGALVEPVVFKIDTPETNPSGYFDFIETNETFELKGSVLLEKAMFDLKEFLGGERKPSNDCKNYLRDLGYTEKLIREARQKICRKPVKDGDTWYWELEKMVWNQFAQDVAPIG